MDTPTKNEVLRATARSVEAHRRDILDANRADVAVCDPSDRALYDRLKVDDSKVDGMIAALEQVAALPDPVGQVRYRYERPDGLLVEDRTAPFGTVLIIYESRPDVTIEAAAIAFKAGNRILLKGGKEAHRTNRVLVQCWHEALEAAGCATEWVQYLEFDRAQTQDFLRRPDRPLDLIVPRGGARLIAFVKAHATCPVLVSGRGNNFAFVHRAADWSKVVPVVLNAKTHKISACNALDKVLVDAQLPGLKERLAELVHALEAAGVEVWVDACVQALFPERGWPLVPDEQMWYEEFLAMKIVIGLADDADDAIARINRYSGGHSVTILTEDEAAARRFMDAIDAAAVYHNASTRFTDGGQFGLGAELAISTDKLHHRGPLGLQHLVTNKWYVFGNGHTRS